MDGANERGALAGALACVFVPALAACASASPDAAASASAAGLVTAERPTRSLASNDATASAAAHGQAYAGASALPGSEPSATSGRAAGATMSPVAGAQPSAAPAPTSAGAASASEPARTRTVSWWAVFEPYPHARPLCELRGIVPHTFTRVFASSDSADAVMRFYLDGNDRGMRATRTPDGMILSNELDGEPQLEIETAKGGIPEGCEPLPTDATLIFVTLWRGNRR